MGSGALEKLIGVSVKHYEGTPSAVAHEHSAIDPSYHFTIIDIGNLDGVLVGGA